MLGLLVVVILMLIVGATVINKVLQQWQTSINLEQKGLETEGVVLHRWVLTNTGSMKPGRWAETYHIAYKFEVVSLDKRVKVYQRQEQVEKWVYERMRPEQKVKVRYLENDPNTSSIE